MTPGLIKAPTERQVKYLTSLIATDTTPEVLDCISDYLTLHQTALAIDLALNHPDLAGSYVEREVGHNKNNPNFKAQVEPYTGGGES